MTQLSPVTGLPLAVSPPNDQDVERALLGAAIMNLDAYTTASEHVTADDFYTPKHQRIWEAIGDMRDRGEAVDQLTLSRRLIEGGMEEAHAKALVIDLAQSVLGGTATARHAEDYAQSIRGLSKKRALGRLGLDFHALGYGEHPIEEALPKAVSMMNGLVLSHRTSAVPVGTAADELIAELRKGRREFITPLGLPELRIFPGELVVLAAGTSVGKSALAVNWAEAWALTRRVVFYAYEMSTTALTQRMMAKHARVPMGDMDNGLSSEQMERMVRTYETYVKSLDLHLETTSATMPQLMGKIRAEAQKGTSVVFIDHLHLIPLRSQENRASAIGSQITSPLKNLATELGIVIVLVAQINREGQKRDGYPNKNDLRDSGTIEQDADSVVMLWKEPSRDVDPEGWVTRRERLGIAEPFKEPDYELVRVGIEKYRNGALTHKWLKYRGEFMEYEPIEPKLAIKNTDRSWYGG